MDEKVIVITGASSGIGAAIAEAVSKCGHKPMLGRIPFAGIRSAYSASKHALTSLTTNLRMDLRAEFPDIHVSTVFPGVVATNFGKNALGGGPDSRQMPNAQPVEEVANVICK